MNTYSLIDSGDKEKLEAFGPYVFSRPCGCALWGKTLSREEWQKVHGSFSREPKGKWEFKKKVPDSWIIDIEPIKLKASVTDFGHVGIFPEHQVIWKYLEKKSLKDLNILNLFAYSGAVSIVAAMKGANVVHLDASKPMLLWAKENVQLNDLKNPSIRYIIDDVIKFLKKEQRRGNKYDGIILDPPSFGRGPQGEVFKIEEDISLLLSLCRSLLSSNPAFVVLSSHTPSFFPTVLQNLLIDMMKGLKGNITSDEMIIQAQKGLSISLGSYAIWEH